FPYTTLFRSPAERDGRLHQVGSRGVDVGRVPQAELEVDGRRDADDLGDLVHADEAAEVVRRLNVDVEGDVDRGTDGGDLGQRQVGRKIQRVGAQAFDHLGRRRVGRGEHD